MLKLAHAAALGLAVLLAGCAGEAPVPAGGPTPVAPQPGDAALRPGLQPRYFYGDFNHVDLVPTKPADVAKGNLGKPVANLAANSNTGRLWEAQSDTQYGVHFSGLIKLQAGEYQFAVKSNDGVRVFLDQARILEDPTAHPDRFTPPTRVTIAKPGWYRLTVQYFQRRGSAALELHWQPPGAAALSIVPAEALAHVAGG
jgi:hypothetical protein